MSATPHHVLARDERWVRVEAARRPVPNRLAAALARPGNRLAETIPTRVIDGRVSQTFDVYENRLVREFHDQIERRLRILERALKTGEKPAASALRTRLMMARRGAAFLDNTSRLASPSLPLTQVLIKRPSYRAAWDAFRRFRKNARLRLADPALDAPMQNIPHLYEVWNTLTLVDVLLRAACRSGWEASAPTLIGITDGGPFIKPLATGPLLVLRAGHRTATLRCQPKYVPSAVGLHSTSFEQQPDMALEVTSDSLTTVHLFDPKYKLEGNDQSKPKKEDIDKMHAYRDAIRGPGNSRVVQTATTLYPGQDHPFEDGIEAVGAIPDAPSDALERILTQALASHPAEL